MPKRRTLEPESVYARHNLEKWLQNDLHVKAEHRHRIWKNLVKMGDGADIRQVPDLPKIVQEHFDDKFVITTSQVVQEKVSEHGSKLVIKLQDGHLIETVIIIKNNNNNNNNTDDADHSSSSKSTPPPPPRSTVCVSSQVGCQMGCTFCATGTMGRIANLTAAEIVEQVHHARQRRHDNIGGVVFMGMGEPLDNFDNVMEAVHSMADPAAFGGVPIPLRRITLSTVGVVHGIFKLARQCPHVQLALSLHAPNDEIRQRIVPTATAYTIAKIMEAVAEYQTAGGRSVMIEYIMIDGVNSSAACAHQLGQLLQERRIKCIVNLIPYNPTQAGERHGYHSPSDQALIDFANVLYQYHVDNDKNKPLRCTIRWSSRRGQNIDAACGQLALKNLDTCNSSSNQECSDGDIEDLGTNFSSRGGNKKARASDTLRKERNNSISSSSRVESSFNDGKATTLSSLRSLPSYWYVMFAGVAVIGGFLLRPTKR